MKKRRAASGSVEHEDEIECKRSRGKMVDRVSALPNDILVSLVSRLPLKDAVATCVLSTRWQNVGLSTNNLRFDSVDFSVESNFSRYWRQPMEFYEGEGWKYINWVNHVLRQHRSEHIVEFRINFCLDNRFASSINEWIQVASEKGAEKLVLEFYSEVIPGYVDYRLPQNIGFMSLKVLQIRHVSVAGQVLEYFLSNCPLLERLSVTTAKDLVNLRVVGSSLALKYLVIQNCLNLKSIEIRDVNIVSFIYSGYRWTNLLISNVPLLSEVSIFKHSLDKDFLRVFLPQLSCCVSNIQFLKLQMVGTVYDENLVFPPLENLKHLELVVAANYYRALHHLHNFLKAAPYLQRLVLMLNQFNDKGSSCYSNPIENAADCPHNHLKVVKIVGYRAHTSSFEHVMYLIKNVGGLEKIVIDFGQPWRYSSRSDKSDAIQDEELKARNHAMQYLAAKIPSTVEFVCV